MLNKIFFGKDKLKINDLWDRYVEYRNKSRNRSFQQCNEMPDELYQLCIQSIHFDNLEELFEEAKKNKNKVAEFVFSTALKMKRMTKQNGSI